MLSVYDNQSQQLLSYYIVCQNQHCRESSLCVFNVIHMTLSCCCCCSIYVDSKSVKNVGKSTYGERVGFSASVDAESRQLHVSFIKNGNSVGSLDYLLT